MVPFVHWPQSLCYDLLRRDQMAFLAKLNRVPTVSTGKNISVLAGEVHTTQAIRDFIRNQAMN